MKDLFPYLVCVGMRVDNDTLAEIIERQNPHSQKRGGLGFGIHGIVTRSYPFSFSSRGVNARINPLSELELRKTFEVGKYSIHSDEKEVGSMQLFKTAPWINEKLKSGKFVAEVLQQHTARNLVGVLGNTRCSLFSSNTACSFCDMKGGRENIQRTRKEILESLEIILSYKKDYVLTFTTSLFKPSEFSDICSTISEIKKNFSIPIALECQPLLPSQAQMIYQTGLDTIMIPMDCYSNKARDLHVPGKKFLLEHYWHTTPELVKLFGAGNVIGNLIVGLEHIQYTQCAIDEMIDYEIIPDLVPLRPLKITQPYEADHYEARPEEMESLQEYLIFRLKESRLAQTAAKIKSGCAACGGCSAGFTPNMVIGKK